MKAMVKKALKKLKDLFTKGFKPILTNIQWLDIPVSTYVRWILTIIVSLNTILTFAGLNPIVVNENAVYELVTVVLNVVVLVYNTYMNNSTSKEALIADEILKALKAASTSHEENAIGKIMDILKELNGEGYIDSEPKKDDDDTPDTIPVGKDLDFKPEEKESE